MAEASFVIGEPFSLNGASPGYVVAKVNTTPAGRVLPTVVFALFIRAIAVLSAVWGITALSVTQAQAHGGLSAAEDMCVLRFPNGMTMHFTGYQPNSSQKEFCEDIPEPGPTIVVLDFFDKELRNMSIGMRVIKDIGDVDAEAKNIDAVTVIHLPPSVYRNGTVTVRHNFDEGKYVGIATISDGDDEYISRFPFSVGIVTWWTIGRYFLIALAVIAVAAIFSFFAMATSRMRKVPVQKNQPS